MKAISCRSTYTAKEPSPFQVKILFTEHLPYSYFFKSILLHKNWRGGGELLLKNDRYAYKQCYCPRRIYIELGPWHFGIFAVFSCQNR